MELDLLRGEVARHDEDGVLALDRLPLPEDEQQNDAECVAHKMTRTFKASDLATRPQELDRKIFF